MSITTKLFIAGLVVLAVLGWMLFSGFADVPCQDGTWNAEIQKCVPG